MSNLTIWWLGDAYPPGTGWPLVVRGKRGICYSLPLSPHAWSILKSIPFDDGTYLDHVRWPDEYSPPSDPPLSDAAARVIGWVLRLPGLTEPSLREWALYGEWDRCETIWRMGLDAEARADEQRDGALLCYYPDRVAEIKRRQGVGA